MFIRKNGTDAKSYVLRKCSVPVVVVVQLTSDWDLPKKVTFLTCSACEYELLEVIFKI